MIVSNFPGCCAALIYHSFPHRDSMSNKVMKEIVDRFLSERKITKEKYEKPAFVFIILDKHQYKIYGKILRKHGFKKIRSVKGNHYVDIYLLLKMKGN